MRVKIYIILLFILIGCDKNDSDSSKITSFELSIETTKPIENIYIYAFNSFGELTTHTYYSIADNLESILSDLDTGNYTFIVVANVGDNLTIPASDIMLLDFITWLNEIEPVHDKMQTGMKEVNIKDDTSISIKIDIKDGLTGLKFNTLRLNIQEIAQIKDYNLRTVVELYQKGSKNCFHRYTTILNKQTFDLNLQAGDYDVLLWTDYIPINKSHKTDHYYTTAELSAIKYNETTPYTASTDSRNAYSLAFEATVDKQEVTTKSITLNQSLSQYRIITTDIERYRIFERINNYPPIEELIVSIDYKGYLPDSFDVNTNKTSDAIQNIKYISSVQNLSDATATIGNDYIFINDKESIVLVTISISDKNGKRIANIPNVEINYRPDQITTISGDFLTAGIITSDVTISVNTNWDDENNHEFK